jgi:hypothetical protein
VVAALLVVLAIVIAGLVEGDAGPRPVPSASQV